MSASQLHVVGLFGASGQIGSAILDALMNPSTKGYQPKVIVYLSPGSDKPPALEHASHVETREVDYKEGTRDEIATALHGVDAVVSALSGPGIKTQYKLLEAAVDAGVKRFIPSEFGSPHTYRTPGKPGSWLHPMWDEKELFNEQLQLHPAVDAGKITYTVIGSGDFYDQAREEIWCPWMQDKDTYILTIVGDPDALVDWSNLADNGQYVAAVLAAADRTANKILNFVSWTGSQAAFGDVLRKYAPGRKVQTRNISLDDARRFVADPDSIPKDIKDAPTAIQIDFWFTVRTIQGEGLGRRPRAQIHNAIFPEVKPTTFEDYIKSRYA